MSLLEKKMAGRNTGFTLMEILVSLSLVAIVFVSLYRLQASSIQQAEAVLFYSQAPGLAQMKLGELVTSIETNETRSGSFEEPSGFSWEASASGYDLPDSSILSEESSSNLVHIRVIVASNGRTFELDTWRLRHDR